MAFAEFGPFLVATVVGCAIAGLGYVFARRAGLGPIQAEYVTTLRDINNSLDEKLRLMQERLDSEQRQVNELRIRVQRLETTIIDLTTENHDLKRQLKDAQDAKILRLESENNRLRGEQ